MSSVAGLFQGERVLVTGAAGFVGSHLLTRLEAEGAHVTALTRRDVDLTDRHAVDKAVVRARPDLVFHLAAAREKGSADERHATTTVNVLSGQWLIEALPDECRAVVRLGSSTEYAGSCTPMNEATPLRPRGFFGATKAAGSLLLAAAAAERGIRSCILRAFQVYGPGDLPWRFVPAVMTAAAEGTVLPLTVPGMRRDWVWVGDVVDACVQAGRSDDLPPGVVFNIGTGTQTSNENLVGIAERVTGRRIKTCVAAHPGRSWDTANWVCDNRAARGQLDWEPQVDLTEGLSRSWAAR